MAQRCNTSPEKYTIKLTYFAGYGLIDRKVEIMNNDVNFF